MPVRRNRGRTGQQPSRPRNSARTASTRPSTQAQEASPPTTTPSGNRSAQINATGASERAAKKAYDEAISAVNACDPLTVGYDECQGRLQRAAKLLLKAREMHRLALAGAAPLPSED